MARPTIYYNGACPLCRRGVEKAQARDADEALVYVDIARQPEALRRQRFNRKAVKKRLHVVEPGGKVRVGVPAFIAIGRRLPRYRWLARLCALPGLRHVLMVAYEPLAHGLYAWNRARGR